MLLRDKLPEVRLRDLVGLPEIVADDVGQFVVQAADSRLDFPNAVVDVLRHYQRLGGLGRAVGQRHGLLPAQGCRHEPLRDGVRLGGPPWARWCLRLIFLGVLVGRAFDLAPHDKDEEVEAGALAKQHVALDENDGPQGLAQRPNHTGVERYERWDGAQVSDVLECVESQHLGTVRRGEHVNRLDFVQIFHLRLEVMVKLLHQRALLKRRRVVLVHVHLEALLVPAQHGAIRVLTIDDRAQRRRNAGITQEGPEHASRPRQDALGRRFRDDVPVTHRRDGVHGPVNCPAIPVAERCVQFHVALLGPFDDPPRARAPVARQHNVDEQLDDVTVPALNVVHALVEGVFHALEQRREADEVQHARDA